MDQTVMQKIQQVSQIYTPASPVEIKGLFSGRHVQLSKVVSFINQKGYHIIIFGDRGVGKTSFSNIIKILFEKPISPVSKISCNSDDTYATLWHNVFSQLSIKYEVAQEVIGFNSPTVLKEHNIPLSKLISEEIVDIKVVLNLLKTLGQAIVILDEFDRLDSDKFNKRLFADTLKAISDTLPGITLIVVGVSEDVNSLIQEHESIERNIGQIHMPAMSPLEVEEIIRKGEQPLDMTFQEDVVQKIIELSSGYPHFTHALCHHAATEAIFNSTDVIDISHLNVAIKKTIDSAHESLTNSYRIATLATKANIFADVLNAASLVQTDEYGYFQANDLEKILSRLLRKRKKVNNFTFHLGKFCIAERGEILKVTGSKNRHRYKFKNPLMRAFIRLKMETVPTGKGQSTLKPA
ncbi:AAA family ATPase [Chitinophaga sp. CF418]|uniref:nSTAND1 domain-containing NTPase n=1 Tax=Chitinophaga sp. CF418 TaxID=1855287 RepID=UPI00091DE6D2|nr:AAA family ATPase [Chitinophaga sp. CF418]SHN45424.1 Cdc6-related protein, AAA superfamily ATPase [Chitinophaga sp. CF418]